MFRKDNITASLALRASLLFPDERYVDKKVVLWYYPGIHSIIPFLNSM
jgi:hypothetical protein